MAFTGAMDTRPDGCETPESPSPEAGRPDLYYRQLQKTTLDYLRASGPPKDSPIMLRMEELDADSPSDGEFIINTILMTMAKQQQSFMATVQNLDRNVQELRQEVKDLRTLKNTDTTGHKNRTNEKAHSYADVVGTTNQSTTTPAPVNKKKRKTEEGPTPPKPPPGKQGKANEETTKANPREGKKEELKETKPVNMAKRKLFATRSAIMPLTDPAKEEALIAKAIATTLTKCECKAPTNLQVFSNKINGTITLTAPPGVDSGNYAKYLE